MLAPLLVHSADTFVIGGRVENSATSEPVRHALVQLNGGENFSGTVFTDEQGAFRIGQLAAGDYSVEASKPGFEYYLITPHAVSSVHVGPSQENVVLPLSPLASIEGRLLNGEGESLQGVEVQALLLSNRDGRRAISVERSVATDDRGRYRVWNLRAGKYYVKAAGRSGGTRLFVGDRISSFGSHECFLPTYYGGAHDLASASPISLRPGDAATADFALPMEPAFAVRGTLANFNPDDPPKFELLASGEDVSANRVALNAGNGNFEVRDVAPGTYILQATHGEGEQATRARVEVQVGSSDVSGVQMRLAPGVILRGRVQKEGGGMLTSKADATEVRQLLPQCAVSLKSSERVDEISYRDGLRGDGPLEFKNVLPGRYQIDVSTDQAYVSSMTYGAVDVLSTRTLTIEAGSEPAALEIAMKQDGGGIAGKVEVENRPSELTVLLVPQFPESVGPVTGLVSPTGEFEFWDLAPGEYVAYAVPHIDDLEYENPDVLASLTGGQRVQVAANAKAQLTLRSLAQ